MKEDLLIIETIWFWQAERSQGEISQGAETWERQTVAAAKQCGALWLPEIRALRGAPELLQAAGSFGCRILCWEKEETQFMQPAELAHPAGSIAVLGPEGGLTENEARLSLSQVVEDETDLDEGPGGIDVGLTYVTHVGVQRLGACGAEEDVA